MSAAKQQFPYGAWPSQLSAAVVAAGKKRWSQPRFFQGRIHWLEGRPAKNGRQAVIAATLTKGGAQLRDATPADANLAGGIHEYGGGEYGFAGGELVYSAAGKPGIQRGGGAPLTGAITNARYGDFAATPCGRWLVAVEETPEAKEPANRLVAFNLSTGRRIVIEGGCDFVSSPVFSPDGARLAYLCWNHPNMPWDGNELRALGWNEAGPRGAPRRVAGGVSQNTEAITQPRFSPGGALVFVSDRSGYWNLWRESEGAGAIALAPRAADFGRPQWVLGMRTWGFLNEAEIVAVLTEQGCDHVERINLQNGASKKLAPELCAIDGLDVQPEQGGRPGNVALIGGGATQAAVVAQLNPYSGALQPLAQMFEWKYGAIAKAEAVTFASAPDAEAHAFLYRPVNERARGPAGAPPLLVRCHGGPTGMASPALALDVQFWSARGFAVADVNYRGSGGFGRAYREQLSGRWGEADVQDCLAAVRHLAAQGISDPRRCVIRGGSAGGFTALCALAFHNCFAAGASYYGVADLEELARGTHKFEARYLDKLVGPYPQARALYRARSPLHSAQHLNRPVIFFQGAEDAVVPPAQSAAMARALAARGVAHAHAVFEGEGHGFRRAENIRTALEGEWWFYGQALGYESGAPPRGITLHN